MWRRLPNLKKEERGRRKRRFQKEGATNYETFAALSSSSCATAEAPLCWDRSDSGTRSRARLIDLSQRMKDEHIQSQSRWFFYVSTVSNASSGSNCLETSQQRSLSPFWNWMCCGGNMDSNCHGHSLCASTCQNYWLRSSGVDFCIPPHYSGER